MTRHSRVSLEYETGRAPAPTAIVYGDDGIIELPEAVPSPVMVSASRIWGKFKATLKASALVALMGIYPATMAQGHNVDDSPVALDFATQWASPEAGVAMTLIAREVKGPGWTADRPAWHPHARLVAMPAWQSGLMNALSEHTALNARLVEADGYSAPDLRAAARLLKVDASLDQGPRLVAAAEALARYEGLAQENLAYTASGEASLIEELRLFVDWADRSVTAIDPLLEQQTSLMAEDSDIDAFYTAKAHAHIAHELLDASARAENRLMSNAALRANVRRAETAWRAAAEMDPIFVQNGSGEDFGTPNHLADMKGLMIEARSASLALIEILESSRDEMYIAQLDATLISGVALP